MKNWTPPRVNSEILIEKTSLSSWVRTPVLAFLSESRLANENCHQMKPKSNLNRWPRPSCTYCKAVRGCFLKKHILWTISVTAGKFAPKKTSYYGRLVKALDLRSNWQVSSWVRTPVVAFLLKTAVGNEFVTEGKQMTVSEWLGQWNDSMNYDFHQITIFVASMKNWNPPRVDSEILTEKTSLSSWVQTPVLAFLSERGLANENCHQMKPKSILNRSPKPSCTYCKAVRRCFLKKHIIWTISVTAGKFAPKKNKLLWPTG